MKKIKTALFVAVTFVVETILHIVYLTYDIKYRDPFLSARKPEDVFKDVSITIMQIKLVFYLIPYLLIYMIVFKTTSLHANRLKLSLFHLALFLCLSVFLGLILPMEKFIFNSMISFSGFSIATFISPLITHKLLRMGSKLSFH